MQYSIVPTLWDSGASSYFDLPQPTTATEAILETATTPAPSAAPDQVETKAQAQGIVSFEQWLKERYPDVYQGVITSRPDIFIPEFALSGMRGRRGLRGLGEDTGTTSPTTDWGKLVSDLISGVTNALPTIAQYQGQRDLIQLNIARAEKGLPMISGGEIAPQVNVGVAPNTLWVFGGLAAAGLLLVSMRKRR